MDRTFLTTLALVLLTESVSAVVIIGPEEVLIEDKSSANLTCVGSGTNLTAEWRKDGQILSPSDRVQFSAENTSVLISPVRRTDSGEYRCTLSNTNSSNTAAYSLTVNYGPDVRMLGAARVEEGSDILLYCFADSFPFASVTWIINGETVRAALLYILEKSNHSNSGNYTCTAYNDITGLTGTAEHFITVTGKDIDSGLSPGVAAGITVAVICAVELLAVGLYFLIIHLKNPDEPVCQTLKPKKGKGNSTSSSRATGQETEFKTRPESREPSELAPEPLYETLKPSVPSRDLKPCPAGEGPDLQENDYCTTIPGC